GREVGAAGEDGPVAASKQRERFVDPRGPGVAGHGLLPLCRAGQRNSGRNASRPSTGPGTSSRKRYCGPRAGSAVFSSWIAGVELAKPMQWATVSADPTSSRGAYRAFNAENCGESPTTTMPQKSRNATNT